MEDIEKYMNTNMRKTMIKIAFLFFASSLFSCTSSSKAVDNEKFNNIMDRDWYLAKVRKGDNTIIIDRTNAPKDIYTINFDAKRLFGVGAPNRYRALYTDGENHALSTGRIASTRMAALYESENFTEHEYFEFLQKVNRWYIHNGNLELCLLAEDGVQVSLIFF